MNAHVSALTVYDNKLIAAGYFTVAGGTSANNIAAWDGSSWSALGSGMNDHVLALTVYDNKLIAAGYFTVAGGTSANNIAAWDGNSWTSVGSGIDGWVKALTVYDNKLIAGGQFFAVGDVAANSIAAWDGSAWSALGQGVVKEGYSASVNALTIYDNKLIAEGWFTEAGAVNANNIAAWNGVSWSAMGSGIEGADLSSCGLAVYDNKLIAGGHFTSAGGQNANNIAAWDGSSWSTLGSGIIGYVSALAVYNNKLVAGGSLTRAGVGTNGIASWDGVSWSAMGSGTNGPVNAFTTFKNDLVAGGDFTMAGSKVSAYLATWTKHDPVDVEEHDGSNLPKAFTLVQNYPNPFNPTTTIEYSVPTRSHVTVEILNLLGQRVRTLIDEMKSAGNYRTEWDGTDAYGKSVSTGVYLYRFRAGDHEETKKMLLIK